MTIEELGLLKSRLQGIAVDDPKAADAEYAKARAAKPSLPADYNQIGPQHAE